MVDWNQPLWIQDRVAVTATYDASCPECDYRTPVYEWESAGAPAYGRISAQSRRGVEAACVADLVEHMTEHYPGGIPAYRCETCGESFDDSPSLDMHREAVHE